MYISTIELGGFQSAFKSLVETDSGYVDHIENQNDIDLESPNVLWHTDDGYNVYVVGPKDLEFATKLILKHNDGISFTNSIMVWVEIIGPTTWFNEFNKYTSIINAHTIIDSDLFHHDERVVLLNYKCLRSIYFDHRHNENTEWSQFCKWITTLPLASKLITFEYNDHIRDYLTKLCL